MSGENEPTRIIIEREEDWTRARTNVLAHARTVMESRLLSSGVADEALKKEVRGRVEKVSDIEGMSASTVSGTDAIRWIVDRSWLTRLKQRSQISVLTDTIMKNTSNVSFLARLFFISCFCRLKWTA